MKRMTRRDFVGFAGLSTALMALKPARAFAVPSSTYAQVERVSAFSAPFLVEELRPGRPLDVVWRREKACLALDEYLVGWLPRPSAQALKQAALSGHSLKVRVERTDISPQGHLVLFVEIRGR